MPSLPASRRLHVRLLVAVVALIVYGSLFPFQVQSHEPSWADIWRLLRPDETRPSLSDLVANVLLFVPYGLLLVTPLLRGRLGLAMLAGVVLAVTVQYLQFWFPDRQPSGTDAVLNGVGMLSGWALGRAGAPLRARGLLADLAQPHFALLATELMLLWLVDRWFPLVPTLDVQNLKDGLKPLLDWSSVDVLDVLRHAVGWLVFLRLARYCVLQRLGLAAWAVACVLIVALEPLFLHNTIGPANVLGLAGALLLAPVSRSGPASLALLALLLVGLVTAQALEPYRFAWVGGFHWVPFAGSLAGDPLAALPPLIEKLYLYGSLVFFVRYLGLSHRSTCLWVGSLLLGLEGAQLWLPGRTPEITDPLLALLMAALIKPVFDDAKAAASLRARRPRAAGGGS